MEDAKDASDAVREVSTNRQIRQQGVFASTIYLALRRPTCPILSLQGSGVIVDGREIKVEVATGVRGSGSRGGNSGNFPAAMSFRISQL